MNRRNFLKLAIGSAAIAALAKISPATSVAVQSEDDWFQEVEVEYRNGEKRLYRYHPPSGVAQLISSNSGTYHSIQR